MSNAEPRDLASEIGINLPYLRRYARALTGSQDTGDRYAAATLEAVLEDTSVLLGNDAPKVALFSNIALMVAILLWRPQGVYPVTNR